MFSIFSTEMQIKIQFHQNRMLDKKFKILEGGSGSGEIHENLKFPFVNFFLLSLFPTKIQIKFHPKCNKN